MQDVGWVLAIASVVVMCGCGKTPTSAPGKRQDPVTQSDPVAEFKALIRKNAQRLEWKSGFADSHAIDPSSLAIDVRRTESLVSPFEGDIEFTEVTRYSEGSAPKPQRLKVRFLYQDGKWVYETTYGYDAKKEQWVHKPNYFFTREFRSHFLNSSD